MYTTTTPQTEAPMEATRVIPRAASSFFKAYFQDITCIRKFTETFNAQPKKSADAFTVFQALTGCKIASEDAHEFTQVLVEMLNYNNLKLKHALFLVDGETLNLSHTATPNTKPKQVKPASTFAALSKLAGDDPLRPQMQCLHLEESVVMVTDAHKLLTVECTHGTRQWIEQDAQTVYERASLQTIAQGRTIAEVEAMQEANTDRLKQWNKTVLINASTGEVTDEQPLNWRNIMPLTPATHERTLTAGDLLRHCTLGMDKARNIDKNVTRVFRFKHWECINLDAFTVNVNAQLLLEIATALNEMQCAWINLTFEQSEKGSPAVRVTAITGDGMKVEGLLMPIAASHEPQLIVEQLSIFKR